MNLESLTSVGFFAFLALAGCVLLVQWARWRSQGQKNKGRWGFYPAAASLALHHLQAIMQPQVQHVIEEKLDEHADEDDASDPNDPRAHLLRQARKIRSGEPVEQLTALWRPD